MARKQNFNPNSEKVKEELLDNLEVDLEDIILEPVEDEKPDETPDTPTENAEDKDKDKESTTKKEKKTNKEKKTKKENKDMGNVVTATMLAEQLGTTPFALRGWLRKMFPNRKKGTAWRWEKGSKELQDVIDMYNSYQEKSMKRKEKLEEKSKPVEDIDVSIIE